jgi:hypothetical protein
MDQKFAFRRFSLGCLLLVSQFAMAATWYVDVTHGSDNNNCKSSQHACKTIGHAILLASAGDSVMVAPATYTENLTINMSLNVIGSGAQTTIVDGGGNAPVFAIPSGCEEEVKGSGHVTLSNMTIRNGGAVFGGPGGFGGGICNAASLTVNNSTVSNNFSFQGGGIANFGSLTINDSAVSNNRSGGRTSQGGGIANFGGSLTINNSTVSGNNVNSGDPHGGGIVNTGTVSINNSTISGNSATAGSFNGSGGGIFNFTGSTVTLQNSIVANNPKGGDCSGAMNSNGYNLSSDDTCNFNGPGDLNNTDPKLGTLGNRGGPTQTIPLLAGSPAIDSGNPSGCTDGQGHRLKTDQRGMPRPNREDAGGCDRGAYERQSD